MEPEKRIVEFWLNQKGFFVLKNINAGKSVIDFLALKFDSKNSSGDKIKLDKVVQVEVACSVSGEVLVNNYLSKFKDKNIMRKIKSVINSFVSSSFNNSLSTSPSTSSSSASSPVGVSKSVGNNLKYENWLITNTRVLKKDLKRDFGSDSSVSIIPFKEVIDEVIKKLDRQNYQDSVIRSLQLLKFLYLKSLMRGFRIGKQRLSRRERINLLKELLKQKGSVKVVLDEGLGEVITKRFLRKNKDWLVDFIRKLPKKERVNLFVKVSKTKKKGVNKVDNKRIKTLLSYFE